MISNNHVNINMHFYCNICDKEVKTDLKRHRVCGKLGQTQTINNPKLSDLNRIFYDYVLNHYKKYEFYTNEVVFKNEFETIEFYYDNTPTNDIEFYIKHPNFSHISGMIFKTISDKRNMTYEYYIKQPKHMAEHKLNMINAKKPHLINTLDRRIYHPLIRKYFHIPFSN